MTLLPTGTLFWKKKGSRLHSLANRNPNISLCTWSWKGSLAVHAGKELLRWTSEVWILRVPSLLILPILSFIIRLMCNNSLPGLVPLQFGRLFVFGVRELILHRNGLDALIPTDCRNLVSYNRLSESIPVELGLLAQLKMPNDVTGSIPSTLGDLSASTELELNKNGVRCSIPQQLGMLTNLSILYLHENQLTGHIPLPLSNISAVISENSLTVVIRQEYGILPNLQVLHLYESQLSGQIPTSLTNRASSKFGTIGLVSKQTHLKHTARSCRLAKSNFPY